jgi:hypothetical protein
MKANKKVIGAKESISIIDLELFGLDAKVDTGADSNALHCDDIVIDGDEVEFTLHDKVHPAYHGKTMRFPIYTIKKVKSSNGMVQNRVAIKVTVEFFDQQYSAVISLSNRAKMKYPMLIGRKFLSGRFLVDVSQ